MTRVTDLSVRGFKAIEEVDIQPGGVNLIVGRNNVGKTSLLEAMYLCLDPTSLRDFRGHLDKLIRDSSEFSTAEICVDYFVSDNSRGTRKSENSSRRQLRVEAPDSEEIYTAFLNSVGQSTEEHPDRSKISEKTKELIVEAVEEALDRTTPKRIGRNCRNSYAAISVNEKNYGFFMSDDVWQTKRTIRQKSKRIFKQKFSNSRPEEKIEETYLDRFVHQILKTHQTSDRGFIGESPPIVDGIRFIKTASVDGSNVDTSEEGAAIKRSDIEEFLVDNDIVEGLRDFSFDRLVFAEGEQKDEVPYDFMGSGFKTLVGILWELFDTDTEEDVVLIEEPAVHMHPGYVNEFTDQLLTLARQRDIQLFLTTHREDLIESFFSPATEHAHGEYLSEEFQLVKMTEPLTTQLDYEQAQAELEDVNADLRGI